MNMDFRFWDIDPVIDTILEAKDYIKRCKMRYNDELPKEKEYSPVGTMERHYEEMADIHAKYEEMCAINKKIAGIK